LANDPVMMIQGVFDAAPTAACIGIAANMTTISAPAAIP
jgi:hypothetical protein